MNKFEYSVSIRTLGKGGDKFKKELESLHAQTIKPKHIYVCIAEGFQRPEFQVGYEEYISVPKGLVHQRGASADIVEEDFILILDDDVYFPEDAVEKMYAILKENKADAVAPDTFPNHEMSLKEKIKARLANDVRWRSNDNWAIKIEPNGTFSYNNNPRKGGVYLTQSAAGPAVFIKTKVFKDIHYKDEYWVDTFPAGSLGEDQIMFYKIFRNGYKLMMQYDAGIIHLDASTNKASQKTYEKLYYRAMAQYLIWHRCCYGVNGISEKERSCCKRAYRFRFLLGGMVRLAFSILKLDAKYIKAHVRGYKDAKEYANSKEYQAVPNFII